MLRSRRMPCRILSISLAALLVAGCSSWRAQEGPPSTILQGDDRPDRVRLVFISGEKMEVHGATIAGDSLIAERRDVRGSGWGADSRAIRNVERVAIQTSDVQSVQHRKFNLAKTVLWCGVVPGALVGGMAIAMAGFTVTGW